MDDDDRGVLREVELTAEKLMQLQATYDAGSASKPAIERAARAVFGLLQVLQAEGPLRGTNDHRRHTFDGSAESA